MLPTCPGDERTAGIGRMDYRGSDDDRGPADQIQIRACYVEKMKSFAVPVLPADVRFALVQRRRPSRRRAEWLDAPDLAENGASIATCVYQIGLPDDPDERRVDQEERL